MSEIPPGNPQDPFPPAFKYASPDPMARAAKLVRLMVIFNYISVGLDGLLFLMAIGSSLFFALVLSKEPLKAGDPPPLVFAAVYGMIGTIALIFGIFKLIATRKVQTLAPKAWGWGLALGIVGCVQLLCASCCLLQVASGVFTIVCICFQHVKDYLAAQSPGNPYAMGQ